MPKPQCFSDVRRSVRKLKLISMLTNLKVILRPVECWECSS